MQYNSVLFVPTKLRNFASALCCCEKNAYYRIFPRDNRLRSHLLSEKILDDKTEQPVDYAVVSIDEKEIHADADDRGRFS